MDVLLAILPIISIAFVLVVLVSVYGIVTKKKVKKVLVWALLATLIACAIKVATSPITRPTLSLIDKQSEVNQHKQQATVVEIPTLIDNTRKSEGVEVTTQLVDEIKGEYLSK